MNDLAKPLSSYLDVGRALAPRFFRHFLVDSAGAPMGEVFAQHPQLVLALNHGPAAGPLLMMAGYLRVIDQVGAGDRRHFGVTWKAFYDLPIVKHFARFITQTEEVMNTNDYVRMLREGKYNDFMVAPEGDHCAFGNGFDIQPFVSDGFVEIAVRAGVPIVVVSHQGSEAWSAELMLGQEAVESLGRWLPQRWRKQLDRTGILSVPWFPFTRIEAFKMRFDVYHPTVTVDALDAAASRSLRAELLAPDAAAVRRIMQAGVERLRELQVGPADQVHAVAPRAPVDLRGDDTEDDSEDEGDEARARASSDAASPEV